MKIVFDGARARFDKGYDNPTIALIKEHALKWIDKSIEQNNIYQRGRYQDPVKYCYNKKDNSFPTGLLPRVVEFLQSTDIKYELVFDFKCKTLQNKEPIPDWAFDHQRAIIDCLVNYRRIIVSSPTASGKSTAISFVVEKFREFNTLIILHQNDLIYDLKTSLENYLDEEVGIVVGSKKPVWKDVTVAGCSMLRNRLEEYKEELEKVDLLIFDECHHYANDTGEKISNACKNTSYRLGLSVGGDSWIAVYNSNTSILSHLTIKELYGQGSYTDNIFNNVENGLFVRAFDGKDFVWKKLKGILRHPPSNKKVYKLKLERGLSLTLTEDHSTYRVNGTTLTEVETKELNKGDFLLYEKEFDSLGTAVTHLNLTEILSDCENVNVYGHFSDWVTKYYRSGEVRCRHRNCRSKGLTNGYCYTSMGIYQKHKTDIGDISYLAKRPGNPIKSQIPVNLFAFALGAYIGNGWVDAQRVGFSINNLKLDNFNEKTEKLLNYLGLEKKETLRGSSTEVRWGSIIVSSAFKRLVPGHAPEKRIPSIVFNFSEEDKKAFLDGMLSTDGHLSIRSRNRRRYAYSTTSEGLAHDLLLLLKSISVVGSLHTKPCCKGGIIDGRQINGKHPSYTVHFSAWSFEGQNEGKFGAQNRLSPSKTGIPIKILDIQEVSEDYVYDLSVDSDEWQTFVASGVLVHNSATPAIATGGDLVLEGVIGSIYHRIPDNIMVELGVIHKPDVHFVEIPDPRLNLECDPMIGKPPRPVVVEHAIINYDYRNELACGLVNEYLKHNSDGGGVLVLVEDVKNKHGIQIVKGLAEYNIPSKFIWGGTKVDERQEVIEEFKSGELPVLVATRILNEGKDVPSIELGINLAGGSGERGIVQKLGRTLRKDKTGRKTRSIFIDFMDNEPYYLTNNSRKRMRHLNARFPGCAKVTELEDLYALLAGV